MTVEISVLVQYNKNCWWPFQIWYFQTQNISRRINHNLSELQIFKYSHTVKCNYLQSVFIKFARFVATSVRRQECIHIYDLTSCPNEHYTVYHTRYRTRHLFNNFTVSSTIRRTTDTFLFISHTTNVHLFKFRCNIFIGVTIIKAMPGSVASGTHCTTE